MRGKFAPAWLDRHWHLLHFDIHLDVHLDVDYDHDIARPPATDRREADDDPRHR